MGAWDREIKLVNREAWDSRELVLAPVLLLPDRVTGSITSCLWKFPF